LFLTLVKNFLYKGVIREGDNLNLKVYLEGKRDQIFNKWLDKFLSEFGESAYFLQKEVDPFTNPFGYHLRDCFEKIVNFLFKRDFKWEEIEPVLEKLSQIRAVQENLPSRAGRLFLILKGILREMAGEKSLDSKTIAELLELEDRIEALMMRYFDFYQSFRERLYEIRIEEFKRNNYLLLKRAGLILEKENSLKEQDSELKKH